MENGVLENDNVDEYENGNEYENGDANNEGSCESTKLQHHPLNAQFRVCTYRFSELCFSVCYSPI